MSEHEEERAPMSELATINLVTRIALDLGQDETADPERTGASARALKVVLHAVEGRRA